MKIPNTRSPLKIRRQAADLTRKGYRLVNLEHAVMKSMGEDLILDAVASVDGKQVWVRIGRDE